MENEQNNDLPWYWYFIGLYFVFLFLNWQMTIAYTLICLAWTFTALYSLAIWILPFVIIGYIVGKVIKSTNG